jgi:hypothetical protein
MAEPTRWVTDTDDGHSQWYVERFRAMAADGADLAGEARLVDAMLPRRARVLDAGGLCVRRLVSWPNRPAG